MSERGSPHKNYCFTLNNPTADDDERLETLGNMDEDVEYLKYQAERGEKSGVYHYQGFICLARRQHHSWLRRLLPRANISVMRGSIQDNIEYVSKEKTKVVGAGAKDVDMGLCPAPPKQGERSDLKVAAKSIRENGNLDEIRDYMGHTYIRYARGLKDFCTAINSQTHNNDPVCLQILWGPTGTGKSRYAMENNPGAYWWTRPQNSACYAQGYQGENCAVMDDFYSWIMYDLILRLCDR